MATVDELIAKYSTPAPEPLPAEPTGDVDAILQKWSTPAPEPQPAPPANVDDLIAKYAQEPEKPTPLSTEAIQARDIGQAALSQYGVSLTPTLDRIAPVSQISAPAVGSIPSIPPSPSTPPQGSSFQRGAIPAFAAGLQSTSVGRALGQAVSKMPAKEGSAIATGMFERGLQEAPSYQPKTTGEKVGYGAGQLLSTAPIFSAARNPIAAFAIEGGLTTLLDKYTGGVKQDKSVWGEAVRGAVVGGPMAFLKPAKTLLGKFIGLPAAQGASMATAGAAYDWLVRGEQPKVSDVVKEAGSGAIGFAILHALSAILKIPLKGIASTPEKVLTGKELERFNKLRDQFTKKIETAEPTAKTAEPPPLPVASTETKQPPRMTQVPELGETAPSSVATKAIKRETVSPEVSAVLKETGATSHTRQREVDVENYAEEQVASNVAKSHNRVMSTNIPTAEDVVIASKLRDKYRRESDSERELEIVEQANNWGVIAGRIVNAFKAWYRGLSPEAFISAVRKDAKRKGYTLTEEQYDSIRKDKAALDQMPENDASDLFYKNKAREVLLDKIIDYTPRNVKFWDWLSAYRYTNMLSSPRTTLRNSMFGAINAWLVRPTSLTGQGLSNILKGKIKIGVADLRDVLRWWKDIQEVMSFGQAKQQASEAFSKNAEVWSGDTLTSGEIAKAREARTPAILKIIPQFLNAQDIFFQAFIRAGERNRLIKRGVSEADASVLADRLAQKYLLRENLEKTAKEYNPIITQGINALGRVMDNAAKMPYLGKVVQPAIPFVRTPTNVAKFMVESSPLGITKGKKGLSVEEQYLHDEQVGRAMFGSLIVAASGLWAATGNTTWAVPRDPKLKEEFYRDKRQPYSIRIGNKWIPFWYFGPYAFALAIPAAIADATKNNPKAMSATAIERTQNTAMGLARFLASMTSVQGANNMLSILEGREDFGAGRALGFMAGQMIPAAGLVRWANTIIDPTFRKARTFTETLKKDLPYFSQQLEAYVDPGKQPAKRDWDDILMPYSLGEYEPSRAESYQRKVRAKALEIKERREQEESKKK